MRPDQIERLKELSENLADVFIIEANPANWSGGGLPRDMTPEQRGNRHWDRKGALGTGAVLSHTLNVIKHYEDRHAAGGGGGDDEPDGNLDKAISDAEQRAQAALARVMDKSKGKDEFQRRATGKA